MDNTDSMKRLVQSLNSGVALVEPGTWTVVFENAKFFQWFPPSGEIDGPVAARIPKFNMERANNRMEKERPYKFESEATVGARTVPIGVEVRMLNEDDAPYVLIECASIAKQKETEYMLESYSKIAEKHARDLQKEKDRVEKLLLNVMPKSVYEEMKDFGTTTPQLFDCASVMMLDFVGFTDMAISRDPGALISELNDIFSALDRIVDLFGCERIKTIGDAYMAVSGLPDTVPDHAHNIAKVALRARRYLSRRNSAHTEQWRCRIGINSGPVIGSVVGIQKYVYDIFGPGVNLAARMEEFSDPMQITLCEDTYELIKTQFVCTDLGLEEIKGFGTKNIYTLESELPDRA